MERKMPIKNMPVDSVEISLRRWQVMEIEAPDGTRSRHVCGHDFKNGRGRASSPIQEFKLDTMIAISRSGTSYKLVGLPGNSRLGKGAWSRWCENNPVISEADVTDEYLNIDKMSTVDLTKYTRVLD
jgi:hypothetical protein